MPDIRERFRVFDRLQAPDLWRDARSREPRRDHTPRRSNALVAAVVGFVVFAAAISGLWYAFSRPAEEPIVPSEGDIAFVQVRRSGSSVTATLKVDGNAQSGEIYTCPTEAAPGGTASCAIVIPRIRPEVDVLAGARLDVQGWNFKRFGLCATDSRNARDQCTSNLAWTTRAPQPPRTMPMNPGTYLMSLGGTDFHTQLRVYFSVRIVTPNHVVHVPDVRGMSLQQARSALGTAGIAASPDVNAGKDSTAIVQSQVPAPGTPADAQTTVSVSLARSSAVTVLHDWHASVPRPFSARCPVVRGVATPSATSGAPGTTITVTGAIYYRNEAGRLVLSPDDDYEVWWDLPTNVWASVGNVATAIASRTPLRNTVKEQSTVMLGDYRPNGACSIELKFVVPNVPPGTYPIAIISANGESTTLYGSFDLTVTHG
jgi:hypothetical protein